MSSLVLSRRESRVQLSRNGGSKPAKARKVPNRYPPPKGEGGAVAVKVARGAGRMITRLLALCLALAFVALVSLGLIYGYRWLSVHPYFALTAIEIEGNSRMSDAEILALSGVAQGDNSIDLNMYDVEQRLVADPWIASVTVERVLPGTLRILVREKEASFWVRRGDTLFYADARGELIAQIETARFASLPVLDLMPGAERWLDDMPRFAAEAGTGRWFFALRDVEWMQAGGGTLTLLLADGRSLALDLADWEAGLDRLASVASDLGRRGEWDFARSLHASGGRVWVRLEKTGS